MFYDNLILGCFNMYCKIVTQCCKSTTDYQTCTVNSLLSAQQLHLLIGGVYSREGLLF